MYKVDDRPPWRTLFLLASQHMFIPVSNSVFAVAVVRAAGGGLGDIEHVITMAFIASAIGITLQALKRGPVGSGYTIAHASSAIYMPASIAAGAMEGLPLIWGMTIIAGIFQVLLSRVMTFLKPVFPPVVCGVVVTMVGFSMVNMAMKGFLGMNSTDHICQLREVAVSGLTLACLVGLSIWGRSWLRLYPLLLSLVVGYLAALALGLVSSEVILKIQNTPWLALPNINHRGFAFDQRVLPLFLVAALAATVKSTGLIITSQHINDPNWQEPDMKNVGHGVLADALGTLAGGLLGTMGTNLSPTSVGLTHATGASSRYIGFATALLVLCLAFLPKASVFISLLPVPVMGAILVYVVCIISSSGLKLIFRGPWDSRRTFLVGISFLSGLSVEVNPHVFDQLPSWVQLGFHSPITVSAIMAICLNLLFSLSKTTQKQQ